jgi:hypothetical protein
MPLPLLPGFLPLGSRNLATPCLGREPKARVATVIHALHKGGDALQFENYRGITVGFVLAMVFAMILEARLNNWAKEKGLRARGQIDFRKDFHTMDNLYILRTFIEQNIHKLKNVYCCFVDFRKAFDTVPCDLLQQVLAKMGIVGCFM